MDNVLDICSTVQFLSNSRTFSDVEGQNWVAGQGLGFNSPAPQQMGPFAASVILLVVSAVRAFQYTELAQYVDSHQEEYVEVNQMLTCWQMTSAMPSNPSTRTFLWVWL